MRKRFLLPLLACILLAGCSGFSHFNTAPVYNRTAPDRTFVGQVLTDNLICCPLLSDSAEIYSMEQDILLYEELPDRHILTRYNFSDDICIASAEIPKDSLIERASFQVHPNRVSYWDKTSNQTVILNGNLVEESRIDIPDGIQGIPLLYENGIYYCTENAVCMLEVQTRIVRILRQMTPCSMSVTQVFDSALVCTVRGEEDRYLYLSRANGAVQKNMDKQINIHSADNMFLGNVRLGTNDCILFSVSTGEIRMLPLAGGARTAGFSEQTNSACITCSTSNALKAISLETGKVIAQLSLPSGCKVKHAIFNGDDRVFVLLQLPDSSEWSLGIWNLKDATPTEESYTVTPLFTAENPDLARMEECRELAEQIGKKYGLSVKIWNDAVKTTPWDYHFSAEYIVPVIDYELRALDERLSRFPDGFLRSLTDSCGDISICIVRSIQGLADTDSVEAAAGLQFEENNCNYIAIVPGKGSEKALYHELCHMIDTQVINSSNVYDNWNTLNPDSFAYDMDYQTNRSRSKTEYLLPGSQSFVDTYSMSFPREDRARILEHTMTPGNEDLFRSPVLQAKLSLICKGIRTTFQLTQYPDVLPWEQYLWDTLAYTG